MFNNRIVIAQKELFISIFNQFGKNYNDYKLVVNKYNSVFRPLAAWMLARDSDEFAINDIVSHLTEYINRKRLNPANIKVFKSVVVINDNSFSDLNEFIDFVHGNFPVVKKQEETQQQQETDRTPILTGDGIRVFKVEKAQDSRELAGDTSWCIAYAGPNNMWQSYRTNQAATFYIVWDENPPAPNQRKVALQYNKNNVQITDIPNRTGSNLSNGISFEFEGKTISGNDIPTYLYYLKSKGVNIDATTTNPETGQEEKVLQNKPLSEEEKLSTNLCNLYTQKYGRTLTATVEDIKNWATGKFVIKAPSSFGFIKEESKGEFQLYEKGISYYSNIPISEDKIVEKTPLAEGDSLKKLYSSITLQSDDFKTYLSKFIGMGWILPNDIFEYLFETPGGEDYLVQYVNSGLLLPKEQIEKIQTKKQLFNSYVKQQLLAFSMGHNEGEIIKFLDPNNPDDKKKVIDAVSKGGEPKDLPKIWIETVPQIGLVAADTRDDLDLTDPLAIKLAISKGMHKIYKRYPNLENTRIYLHIPEAIEPLRAEAIANGYSEKILISPSNFETFTLRFRNMPEEFKDLPEFAVYKNAERLGKIGQSGLYRGVQGNLLDFSNENDLQLVLMYALQTGGGDAVNHDKRFWDYFFNNIDKFQSGAFKRINLERRDLPDNFNENEDDEEQYPFIEDPEHQKNRIQEIVKRISYKFLLDPTIDENVRKYIGTGKHYLTKLYYNKNFDKLVQYVNYWVDLPREIVGYLCDIKNPIFEKLINEIGFSTYFFSSMGFYNLKLITNFSLWYPDFKDQFKIDDLDILIRRQFNDGLHSLKEENYIPVLTDIYPNYFRQNVDNLKISEESKNYIRQKLSISAPVKEQEQLPEEPTIASVNLMVKIAQKLNLKKKYRLADKLT